MRTGHRKGGLEERTTQTTYPQQMKVDLRDGLLEERPMHESILDEAQDFLSQIIESSGLELRFDLHWTQWPMPILTIRFQGPDVPMLVAQDRELLEAMRHLILNACGFHAANAPTLAMVVIEQDCPAMRTCAG